MSDAAILGDLRNALARISRDIAANNDSGQVTNAEVLTVLKAEMPNEIAKVRDRLVDSTLTKMLNDVSGRKRQSFLLSDAPDLFGHVSSADRILTISKETKQQVRKMRIHELEAWVKNREMQAVRDKNKDLKELIIVARKYATSDDETLEVALSKAEASMLAS
jgi:hypothetical protein